VKSAPILPCVIICNLASGILMLGSTPSSSFTSVFLIVIDSVAGYPATYP
jgi:hypothetical protein